MYNQVNNGPNFGQGPQTSMQAAYQQCPQAPSPPLHFQQGPPPPPVQYAPTAGPHHGGLPGHHAYLHRPPATSSAIPQNPSFQVPPTVMQNTGQSYVTHTPPILHGNNMMPHTFSNAGQNSHHSLNLGSQNHHILPPLPPPPHGLLHQEASWALVPPTLLPPPIPPMTLPPLPSSLPPVPPPPPLAPPVISATVSNNDTNQDIGSISVVLDLPPPPPPPIQEKTVQKIEALCQLIAENGPDIEDKTRQNEFKNPEYAFLFGGDPGTEAANSHEYFLWMKKKNNLGLGGHTEKSESQLRLLAVDSSSKQDHLNIAPECSLAYDSDMEMEDDITLSDKDQGWNPTIESLNQQHDGADRESIMNEQILQPQSSIENNPVNVSKQMALGTVLDQSAVPLADDVTKDGASVPAEDINPDRDSGQLTRGGSPMRLLQDYVSDDTSDNENETCLADSVLIVSPIAATSALVAHKDSGGFSETDIRSRSPSRTQKDFVVVSQVSQNYSEISSKLREATDTCKKSVSSRTRDGHIEHNLENQASVNFPTSNEAFHGKDGLHGAVIDYGTKSGNAEWKDNKTLKLESSPKKVNESRRLARQGPTDSDSDDSHNHRTRRLKKRDRSQSRSQSPLDRRRSRRRRSPWRRKVNRSRSCSRSPRNRRSRSRSPIFRRSGDFSHEKMKRDKGECFDFLRGKCYRGASCRYMHHEPDKDVSSKRHRSRHDSKASSHSKKSGFHEGQKSISAEVKDQQCKGVGSQEAQLCQNISGSSAGQEVKERKDVPIENVAVLDHDSQPVGSHPSKSESSRKVVHKLQETLVLGEEPKTTIPDNASFQKAVNSHQQLLVDGFSSDTITSGDAWKPSDGTSQDVIPSKYGLSSDQLKSNVSVEVQEHSENPSQLKNVSDSLPVERSTASASKFSSSEPLLYMLPSEQSVNQWFSPEQPPLHSKASKELPAHSSSTVDLPLHSYQLPPPPPLSHSQGENAVRMPQISRDFGTMQQNVLLPYQSTARDSLQHSHFSVVPRSSMTSLPPPPLSREVYSSSLKAGVATSHVSSEFNQSQLHSKTDFVSQISERPALPSHSQGSQYHDHSNPPTQGDRASQSFAGLYFGREEYYKQVSMLDSKFSSSSSFGSLHPQPKHFSWDSTVDGLHLSSGGKFPAEDHFNSSSHVYPFSQKQPIHNLAVSGEATSVSRYLPDVLDSNHSASLPDFGGSRIRAHYNPYASTFEQPLSSKFSSTIFRQEKDTLHGDNFDSSSILSHTRINGQGVRDVGLSQATFSPKFARAVGQILPRSSGDQYDPLFDSIEPSSTSFKKFDLDQKLEVTGESNISLRPKSSDKSLDSEENKDGEVGAVGLTTSQNNDEYGETADAEVGAVENESLSNPVDMGNMTTGEIEIDQIKSPGKRKKGKDSRSMRLFKVSIANFVKEVLKPSWRQGNMSKVAFKTIVKKTVDKVSGAMKGHHIPKSQAKINQYIDSSQRKLTKLVMGYVDKYVKV